MNLFDVLTYNVLALVGFIAVLSAVSFAIAMVCAAPLLAREESR